MPLLGFPFSSRKAATTNAVRCEDPSLTIRGAFAELATGVALNPEHDAKHHIGAHQWGCVGVDENQSKGQITYNEVGIARSSLDEQLQFHPGILKFTLILFPPDPLFPATYMRSSDHPPPPSPQTRSN